MGNSLGAMLFIGGGIVLGYLVIRANNGGATPGGVNPNPGNVPAAASMLPNPLPSSGGVYSVPPVGGAYQGGPSPLSLPNYNVPQGTVPGLIR